MSSFGQTIRRQHDSLLPQGDVPRPGGRNRFVIPVLCLLGAAAMGLLIALFAQLPLAWLVLACLALCSLPVLVLCIWLRVPLLPILRFALIFSFSFRLEIHFFTIKKHNEGPPGLNLSLSLILALLLLLVQTAAGWHSRKSERVIPAGALCTLWLLFVWCAISVIYGSEWLLGIYSLAGLLTSALIGYVAAACYNNEQQLRHAVLAVAISVGLGGFIGFLQYFFDFATDWKLLGAIDVDEVQKISDGEVSRVGGLLTMANAFAWYLVTFLPLLVAPLLLRFKALRSGEKLLLPAAAGLGTMALILTFARGSWISFVLSLGLLALLAYCATQSEARRNYLWRMAGITVLLAVLSLPFAPMIVTRLTEDDRGAAQTRLPLMEVAVAMIQDNPVFGVGLNSYETVQRKYDKTTDRVTDDFDWPVHNIFLHVAAEAGIPAILLLMLLTALIVYYSWPALLCRNTVISSLVAGVYTGLFAYLFTGLKELGSLGSSQFRMYFLLLGLLIAARRCADAERAADA